MGIPAPYLLYLGTSKDRLYLKTANGIAYWRPELVCGQYRASGHDRSLGLAELSFEEAVAAGAQTLVLGFANEGGYMPDAVVEDILSAMRAGLHVASGLHQHLRDNHRISELASALGRSLFDVRIPPDRLPVGTGVRRAGRRLLAVGTDCSVGKMYTSLAIEKELKRRNLPASFRATGQTGILIAGGGIPLDAVPGDFLSGAIEQLSPDRHDNGWDIIEGQGSLFHPSYAGVSLGLLHGAQPDAIVLCHAIGRPHIRRLPSYSLPGLLECLNRNLQAARLTNPDVVAVGISLNTSGVSPAEALQARSEVEELLGLPCEDPLATGVERIVNGLIEACAGRVSGKACRDTA